MRCVAIACGLLAMGLLIGVSEPAVGQGGKTDKAKAVTKGTSAVFEVYKGNDKKYYFRLKNNDGILLATSGKGYKTRADCVRVIEEIRLLAGKAKIEDVADKK